MTKEVPADESLSIGGLARATGVEVETIRMWERRYGKPAATRLPSGHRRYAPIDVAWLRRVAEAVARGVRASDAVSAPPRRLTTLLGAPGAQSPGVVRACIELAREFDRDGVARRLRAEAERRGPRGFVADVVAPLLSDVGRAWADGDLDVRHEHLVSHLVAAELNLQLAAAASPRRGPRVVFSTLPGERHGLGLSMAAVVAAHAGARCVILGTDTPITETAACARSVAADAVAVSVSLAHGGVDADRELAELRALMADEVRLIAGGSGTRRPRRARSDIEYVEDFGEFENIVRALGKP
jgi:MerR family transcriptional regulator, light-induced transcriptional regulator